MSLIIRLFAAWCSRRARTRTSPAAPWKLAALSVVVALLSTVPAGANPTCFPLTGIEEIEVRVTGPDGTLKDSLGFGAHFSTVGTEDGYGGAHSECFLLFTTQSNLALCYDGALAATALPTRGAQNEFRLDVGPKTKSNKTTLRDVTFVVKRREVKVRATRIAVGPTAEVVPYVVESSFPMRDLSYYLPNATTTTYSSGFWDKNNQFCIEFDGNVSPTPTVLATSNVWTTDPAAQLLAGHSNGVFNNNTPCSSPPGSANRCGEKYLINVIMKP